MTVTGTPINPPDELMRVDPRDWRRMRDRILHLEEKTNAHDQMLSDMRAQLLRLQRDLALFMQGSKERFNALSVLLEQFGSEVDREKLG